MSTQGNNSGLNTCDCCEGVQALTPANLENRPGLSALVYRVGTHGTFLESMKSRLASQDSPALQDLGTRDARDPSIALLDGWATVLDVLTFYQERIANEHYLRTATRRFSLLELARSIGYELKPGVAASTWLVFTVDDSVGAPGEATIKEGTLVQSVPGQDELPQKFDITEEIYAHKDWNALKPRLTRAQSLDIDTTQLYLEGIANNLSPGDRILLLGENRMSDSANSDWESRRIQTVTTNAEEDWTLITWRDALRKPPYSDSGAQPLIYVFRTRAAFFGYNAPDFRTMSEEVKKSYNNGTDPTGVYEWPDFDEVTDDSTIPLDAEYSQLLIGSWVVLKAKQQSSTFGPETAGAGGELTGVVREAASESKGGEELYGVTGVEVVQAANFGLTGKVTELTLDKDDNLGKFERRSTTVHAQSEELTLAEEAISEPVRGDSIVLDSIVSGLIEGRRLIVQGKRIRIRLGESASSYELISTDDDSDTIQLEAGVELIVLAGPDDPSSTEEPWILKQILEINGEHVEFEGELTLKDGQSVEYVAAAEDDEVVSEYAELSRVEAEDTEHSKLALSADLANLFDRTTVSIFANVAAATHGETVNSETLGSGDASSEFQGFELANTPLTYVSAATPSGNESTLEVRVDGVKWDESDSFYGRGPDDRIYISRQANDETVTVKFGDGKTGARLPTGTENVTATYRKGIGLDGMLKAGQLSLLMTKILGVKKVINPIAPSGAADAESLDEARENAPLTVLTLDRIVSVQDFEDFARAFAGISKAQATLLWDGSRELVHVTVCGSDGAAVEKDSDLYTNLAAAIDAARHRDQPVEIGSYTAKTFGLHAQILVDEAYLVENVLSDVGEALESAYSFESRSLGQSVSASELLAIMQSVAGVVAVDLESLNGADPYKFPYVKAARAKFDNSDSTISPAELLTIDTGDIQLEELKP